MDWFEYLVADSSNVTGDTGIPIFRVCNKKLITCSSSFSAFFSHTFDHEVPITCNKGAQRFKERTDKGSARHEGGANRQTCRTGSEVQGQRRAKASQTREEERAESQGSGRQITQSAQANPSQIREDGEDRREELERDYGAAEFGAEVA